MIQVALLVLGIVLYGPTKADDRPLVEAVTREYNGEMIPMKLVLTEGPHRLNKYARALRKTHSTEVLIIEDRYFPDNGSFTERNKPGELNQILIAERAINNHIIRHETKHSNFFLRRLRGNASIFDGHISSGNSAYFGDHSLEEYFNYPTDFVDEINPLDKAKLYQAMVKDAVETITLYQTFISEFPNGMKQIRSSVYSDSIHLWNLNGGAGFKLFSKKIGPQSILFLETIGLKNASSQSVRIEIPLLSKDIPLFSELTNSLVTDGWLLKEETFQSKPWEQLILKIHSQLQNLKNYLLVTEHFVKLIEKNTQSGIIDPKPSRDLLRLSVQMMKTGKIDVNITDFQSIGSGSSRPTIISSMSNSEKEASPIESTNNKLPVSEMANTYQKISPISSPQRLYHWTLTAYAKNYTDSPLFPLKPNAEKGTAFVTMNSEFSGVPVLYTWTHPLTALALNEKEVHGGDLLVAIDINKNAKSIRLESLRPYPDIRVYSQQEIADLQKKYEGVDLILHTFGPKENPVFQEWIILNPKIITQVTVDPEELFPIVKNALKELRNPSYVYKKEELFSFVTNMGEVNKPYYSDMGFRNKLAAFIETYYLSNGVKLKSEIVPLFERRSLRLTCKGLF